MPRHFAFLRGINVGGRTVKSAQLRSIFAGLGFDDVATYLASGNVIFDVGDGHSGTAGLARRIEAGLEAMLGYRPATFLRTCAELAEVASPDRLSGSPLSVEHGVTINVMFLEEPVPADLRQTALALRSHDDDFIPEGRELYWLRRGKMSESPAWRPLEKAIAGHGTVRNLNTVRRLLGRFCDEGGG